MYYLPKHALSQSTFLRANTTVFVFFWKNQLPVYLDKYALENKAHLTPLIQGIGVDVGFTTLKYFYNEDLDIENEFIFTLFIHFFEVLRF